VCESAPSFGENFKDKIDIRGVCFYPTLSAVTGVVETLETGFRGLTRVSANDRTALHQHDPWRSSPWTPRNFHFPSILPEPSTTTTFIICHVGTRDVLELPALLQDPLTSLTSSTFRLSLERRHIPQTMVLEVGCRCETTGAAVMMSEAQSIDSIVSTWTFPWNHPVHFQCISTAFASTFPRLVRPSPSGTR
jgi:hypothetical protein